MRTNMVFQIFAIVIAICFIIIFSAAGVSALQNSKGYTTSIALKKTQKTETHAERLIRELYGSGVVFHREFGDGINFSSRYYCANICVDVCTDGSVRYLCDVKSAGGEDKFLQWLLTQKNGTVIRKEVQDTVEYQYFRSADCTAEICSNLQTGRAFAAKITFIS